MGLTFMLKDGKEGANYKWVNHIIAEITKLHFNS